MGKTDSDCKDMYIGQDFIIIMSDILKEKKKKLRYKIYAGEDTSELKYDIDTIKQNIQDGLMFTDRFTLCQLVEYYAIR